MHSVLVLVPVLAGLTLADDAEQFVDGFMTAYNGKMKQFYSAAWEKITVDAAHLKQANDLYNKLDAEIKTYHRAQYKQLFKFKWQNFQESQLKRKFFRLATLKPEWALRDDNKLTEINDIKGQVDGLWFKRQMQEYNAAKGAPLLTVGEVQRKVIQAGMDAETLNHYWKENHKLAKEAKAPFQRFVILENQVAKANGLNNYAELHKRKFEITDFDNTVSQLWRDVRPLFLQLHAYVRFKLWELHGRNDAVVNPHGAIPASLLGFQWGATASPVYSFIKPFDKPLLDFTEGISRKGHSGHDMAKNAEQYFVDLGLSPFPEDYWQNSVFEKKGDLNCNNANVYVIGSISEPKFRSFYCAEPNNVGHENLHRLAFFTQHKMAVKSLNYIFQAFPNDAVNTAAGDLMENLSQAPEYLKSLGYLETSFQPDDQLTINTLFHEALDSVFFLPFVMAWDQWWFDVARGNIQPNDYNCKYWEMRTVMQGVEPPVDRSNDDFDPGQRLNNIVDEGFSGEFLAKFYKYNLLKGLCTTSGYFDPHNKPNNALVWCDIHGSKAAGAKLKEFLALGASQPWDVALEKVTGSRRLESQALLDYFDPLLKWLKQENQRNGVTPGWDRQTRCQ